MPRQGFVRSLYAVKSQQGFDITMMSYDANQASLWVCYLRARPTLMRFATRCSAFVLVKGFSFLPLNPLELLAGLISIFEISYFFA